MSDTAPKTVGGILTDNLWHSNPIFMQVLGICSALAVTNLLTNTFIMSVGVIFTTMMSNFTVSIIKGLIPRKVRMMVQVLIIAFYVIIVDIVLRAYMPDIHEALGPYVGLIITNCIIMGRAEAFAQSNGPGLSLWDGITSASGYMGVLLVIAFFREILAFGSLFGFRIMPNWFEPWIIMAMPPSAFFFLGIIIWIGKTIMNHEEAAA
ncbi:MAG: NADH:ubiquinone reductase (Na(+)-transporting) subunit D [Spirochaetaceae bacterium]|nr:MAG: NADH:ubiquinone reductase (Na(+)-transporting) subunit D [Spirochaetaceae bacterium]